MVVKDTGEGVVQSNTSNLPVRGGEESSTVLRRDVMIPARLWGEESILNSILEEHVQSPEGSQLRVLLSSSAGLASEQLRLAQEIQNRLVEFGVQTRRAEVADANRANHFVKVVNVSSEECYLELERCEASLASGGSFGTRAFQVLSRLCQSCLALSRVPSPCRARKGNLTV